MDSNELIHHIMVVKGDQRTTPQYKESITYIYDKYGGLIYRYAVFHAGILVKNPRSTRKQQYIEDFQQEGIFAIYNACKVYTTTTSSGGDNSFFQLLIFKIRDVMGAYVAKNQKIVTYPASWRKHPISWRTKIHRVPENNKLSDVQFDDFDKILCKDDESLKSELPNIHEFLNDEEQTIINKTYFDDFNSCPRMTYPIYTTLNKIRNVYLDHVYHNQLIYDLIVFGLRARGYMSPGFSVYEFLADHNHSKYHFSNVELINKLQEIHNISGSTKEQRGIHNTWESKFRKIASLFNLQYRNVSKSDYAS